jgi:putative endopeptidase
MRSPEIKELNNANPAFISAMIAEVQDTDLDTLKAYMRYHLLTGSANRLPRRFDDENFNFYGRVMTGQPEQSARWKRCSNSVNGALGEALGQVYVEQYFAGDSKAKMLEMVHDIENAMDRDLDQLDWMSAATKAKAKEKLKGVANKIGYPDKWRDYTKLKVDVADLYGNVERSAQFEWDYQLSDLGKPVDRKKWGMTPQTVNAYNGGLENKIVFPAGILQAPYFDPAADAAVNYGAIGSIIGHEISHGFDDQGRKIDSTGAVRDWWTKADADRFEAQAKGFGAQYNTYEPVPGMHVNGELTMGENIADLAGVLIALDAYHASLGGKPAPVVDGLSGDQRFFLGFAQAWRSKERDDSMKAQMASDPHTPDKYRIIGPLRNVDAWYAAFDVKSGKYFLQPAERTRIW